MVVPKKLLRVLACLMTLVFALMPAAEGFAAPVSAGPGTVTINSVTASSTAIVLGAEITCSVNLVHSADYTLHYTWIKDGKNYSSGNTTNTIITLKPTAAGSYALKVEAYNKEIGKWQSQATSSAVYVAQSAFSFTSVKINSENIALGTSMVFTPSVSGGSGKYAYSYKIYKGTSLISTITESTSRTNYSYVPTTTGTYYCVATVKDTVFNMSVSQSSSVVTVTEGLAVSGVTPSGLLVTRGNSVSFTVNATGGIGSLTYDYYLSKDNYEYAVSTGQAGNVYTFTPPANGVYQMYVEVTDAAGTKVAATSAGVEVVTNITLTSISVSPSRAETESNLTFTANGAGSPSRYIWEIIKDGINISTQSTTEKRLTIMPSAPGTYSVHVTALLERGEDQLRAEASSSDITVTQKLKINGVSIPSTVISIGNEVTFTAEVVGGTDPKSYVFRIFKDGSLLKTESTSTNTYSFKPASLGVYVCEVGVKDNEHTGYIYGRSDEFEVVQPLKISSISMSGTKIPLGSNITFTPVVGGGKGAYKFIYCMFNSAKQLTMVTTTDTSYTYTPAEGGTYYCKVYVTDQTGVWQNLSSNTVDVLNSIVTVSAKLDKTKVYTKEAVTVTASIIGGARAYAYRVFNSSGTKLTESISSFSTFTYTPEKEGTYKITVEAWDGSGWYAAPALSMTAYKPFQFTTVNMDRLGGVVGDTIHISTDAANGIPDIQFIYCMFNGNTQLTMYQTKEKNYAYTFTQPGTYHIDVYATDGKGQWKVNSRPGILVTGSASLDITSINVNKTSAAPGDTVKYSVSTTGGVTGYIYCVFRNGQQLTMTNSTSSSFSYTIPSDGVYTMTVYATDGRNWINKTASTSTNVAGAGFRIVSVTADSASKNKGETIKFTTKISGAEGTVKYIHCVFRDQTQLTMTESDSPVFSYTAKSAGRYHIDVYAADNSGVWQKASSADVTVEDAVDPLRLNVTTSSTALTVGDVVEVKPNATGGYPAYEYIYCLFRDGTQLTMNRGTSSYYTFKLDATGTYRIDVYCGDSTGKWIMQSSATIAVH